MESKKTITGYIPLSGIVTIPYQNNNYQKTYQGEYHHQVTRPVWIFSISKKSNCQKKDLNAASSYLLRAPVSCI